MTVGEVGAVEKLLEVVEADTEGDGKANGRPERVASADPVPEGEHVGFVDAKVAHLGSVRGQCHEVLRYRRLLSRAPVKNPSY